MPYTVLVMPKHGSSYTEVFEAFCEIEEFIRFLAEAYPSWDWTIQFPTR